MAIRFVHIGLVDGERGRKINLGCLVGWMGIEYFMVSGSDREKEREREREKCIMEWNGYGYVDRVN